MAFNLLKKEPQLTGLERKVALLLEDIEQISAAASHDLKDQLREAVGYCKAMKEEGTFNKDLIDHVDSCLYSIIDNVIILRNFSYLSQNTEAPHVLDINDILNRVIQYYSKIITQKNVRIEKQLPPIMLTGRSEQLYTLFMHLIHNALQYTGTNAPVIEIIAKEKPDHWVICIKDNGTGIEPELRHFIFGLFRRGYSDSATPGKGAGLAYAKKVAQNHLGDIWMESEPNQYTRMFVSLAKHSE